MLRGNESPEETVSVDPSCTRMFVFKRSRRIWRKRDPCSTAGIYRENMATALWINSGGGIPQNAVSVIALDLEGN